ncbi:MAG: hypothetical protein LQ342_002956 [Letrouitia transgressa]|nr:MAG: hypothetical protein LQ342_002956 [Letrouitia transgressa]
MNLSASLNVFKLLRYPGLCIPHATVSTFNDLPIPLSKAFGEFRPDIRAVILDKDNCFARPKQNSIYVPYKHFRSLREVYPHPHLLIVSNSAGTDDDIDKLEASALSEATGVPVFHHSTKKPGCGSSVLEYIRNVPGSRVISADQIAVIGDRLFTDIMMANLIGCWAIWIKVGVVETQNQVSDHETNV